MRNSFPIFLMFSSHGSIQAFVWKVRKSCSPLNEKINFTLGYRMRPFSGKLIQETCRTHDCVLWDCSPTCTCVCTSGILSHIKVVILSKVCVSNKPCLVYHYNAHIFTIETRLNPGNLCFCIAFNLPVMWAKLAIHCTRSVCSYTVVKQYPTAHAHIQWHVHDKLLYHIYGSIWYSISCVFEHPWQPSTNHGTAPLFWFHDLLGDVTWCHVIFNSWYILPLARLACCLSPANISISKLQPCTPSLQSSFCQVRELVFSFFSNCI